MLRRERMGNGRVRYTPLANFTARIASDILRDDGEQERREFGIEAELGGYKVVFPLTAAEFGRMNWVLHRWGPRQSSIPVSTNMLVLPPGPWSEYRPKVAGR
jgi:hypothetical protein